MPFDPLEFLTVAEGLAAGTPSEGAYRTSVGRAYYCLFLVAQGRVASSVTPKQRKREGSHKAYINEVRRRHLTTGNQLDALRVLRVEADYFLRPSSAQYADWNANWQRADTIATAILPRIQRI